MKTHIQNLFTRRGGASCAAWVLPALLAGIHQAAGQSALWKYNPESFRGYRQGDDRVGQWSDVMSIPVAG
jgi:hypothetical protein